VSQENIEVVKVAYEAFARGGLERFMEHFTDDVDYRAVEGEIDDIGPLRGKDAVRAYLQDWVDMFDEFTMELMELSDAGEDTVVAVERFGGRAKRSGVETDQLLGDLFTIRDGKIASCREYATREQALQAAGLFEEATSQENVDLARAFFAAYNARDVETLTNLLHPTATVTSLSQRGGLASTRWEGAGVRRYFEELEESWVEVRAEIEDYRAHGDYVVALGRICGTGRMSEVELDAPLATTFLVEGSRIARVESYGDPNEALEAAGLSE
jgi:ketosteroid isomerase-like protein